MMARGSAGRWAVLTILLPSSLAWISHRSPLCSGYQRHNFLSSLSSLHDHSSSLGAGLPGGLDHPDGPTGKAYPLQTPHAGRHFQPSHPAYQKSRWKRRRRRRRGRFTEGWYSRITLVEQNVSFAIITSIEDAGHNPPSPLRLSCIQVVGPNDSLCVQASRDDSLFWAWKEQLGYGCTFAYKHDDQDEASTRPTALAPEEWEKLVQSGFQILPLRMLGRVDGHDAAKSVLLGVDDEGDPMHCEFDISIEPLCGWGNADSPVQKNTGGWLSSFDVFEPHWQVTMADGRASGRIVWQNETYDFVNAPFYSEKNWGAALPTKWYWTQCNSFDGYPQLSVTAGGGIRKLPLGKTEELGMVSVHYQGRFYEATPFTGTMDWKISTWGRWDLSGTSTTTDPPFEVEVGYQCKNPKDAGLIFYAPTPDQGMVKFCKDTFEADVSLTLWELEWNEETKQFQRRPGKPLIEQATGQQGGAEIGGGPWWDEWQGTSRVSKTIRFLLRLPDTLPRWKRKT